MANHDFENIQTYAWDFLRNNVNSGAPKWQMPLNFIEGLSLVSKGNFGKFLVNQFCISAGLNVEPSPQNVRVYDWKINDHRVAVKFSFEGKDETWTFNQIRYPHNYEYLCCLGILPTSKGQVDGKCFLFSKQEIDAMINQDIFTFQHPGKQTWKWMISSKVVPDYYPGDATIDELVHILSNGQIILQQ